MISFVSAENNKNLYKGYGGFWEMKGNNKYCNILGIDVAVGTKEELLAGARRMLRTGGVISTVNPEILRRACDDPELFIALSESLPIPDGIGVVAEARKAGVLTDRIPGIELAELLLDDIPIRLAIVGGEDGVAKAALENLTARHRSVIPVFYASGFGEELEMAKIKLKELSPELVFICLGSPLQDVFIYEMKKKMIDTLFIGLGGAADVWAGRVRRAPRIVSRLGLEWAYRIIREPKRLRRIPMTLSFFGKSRKYRPKSVKIGKKSQSG